MEQSELNKKLQLAIGNENNKYKTEHGRTSDKKDYLHVKMIDTNKAATACEIICLQEKIDLLNETWDLYNTSNLSVAQVIHKMKEPLTEKLNPFKKV